MEQTLQQQGEKVLKSLLEIVQNGLDKAPDYVLDFFNRFQNWTVISDIYLICFMIALITVLLYARYRIKKYIKRNKGDLHRALSDYEFLIGTIIFFIVLFILPIAWGIYDIIKVSTIPELSLIEFLQPKGCK